MTALHAYIKAGSRGRVGILGVGSELRRDDGAGMYLIKLLAGRVGDTLLIGGATAPENFTGQIKRYRPDTLFVVDAAWLDLPPGEAAPIEPAQVSGLPFSTHMLPLSVTLDYLRRECGCDCRLIGIQPVSTEQGLGLTDSVKAGAERLAEAFVDALTR